jgi:hypothetical protein
MTVGNFGDADEIAVENLEAPLNISSRYFVNVPEIPA